MREILISFPEFLYKMRLAIYLVLISVCIVDNVNPEPELVKSREKRFLGPIDMSRITRILFSPETISLQMTFSGAVQLNRAFGFAIGGE